MVVPQKMLYKMVQEKKLFKSEVIKSLRFVGNRNFVGVRENHSLLRHKWSK